ncbi:MULTISPECIES: hypothetical protein [unclassified Gordonia (in: high G+C Gram-positive bacteria)]|uniref:hypothetical protein n=1 Tax=unclassified Gordonia (in: high G+C Gram-positive bacteria) TaxID=2657482 RepID=UPI000AFA8CDE|nr:MULTISPECIES: hypothetical protein [unclassified Gordonia (in: high G+C Gram-positive bacteria)]
MYHPWRDARDREHLNITFERLADGRRGCLRGDRVTINTGDDQAQRRSTLAHELVHDERRVFPTDRVLRAREELTVERIAARRLIQLEALVDALLWSRDARETAAELWVDVPMLVVFVQSMTEEEKVWVGKQLEERA